MLLLLLLWCALFTHSVEMKPYAFTKRTSRHMHQFLVIKKSNLFVSLFLSLGLHSIHIPFDLCDLYKTFCTSDICNLLMDSYSLQFPVPLRSVSLTFAIQLDVAVVVLSHSSFHCRWKLYLKIFKWWILYFRRFCVISYRNRMTHACIVPKIKPVHVLHRRF